MKLIRYRTSHAVDELQNILNASLERYSPLLQGLNQNHTTLSPLRTDVYQDDRAYYLQAEVPGIDKKNLSIELDGTTLTITAGAKNPVKRSIQLPNAVQKNEIQAKLENGVLTLTLPNPKKQTIRIQ